MTQNKSRFVLLCQQALACAVVVLLAAPAAGIGTLELVSPAPQEQPAADDDGSRSVVADAPVAPSITRVPLTGVASDAALDAATDRPAARLIADTGTLPSPDEVTETLSDPQPVEGYATVGVTWSTEEVYDDEALTVSVRSLEDGAWSDWQDLPYDAHHGPEPSSPEAASQRFGTDAVVVGDVDDVQVRAVTSEGSLPSEMSLEIVDPGEATAEVRAEPEIDTADLGPTGLSRVSATTTPEPDPTDPAEPVDPVEPGEQVDPEAELVGTPADVTPRPKIFSRAQWGADERMRDKGSLRYFEVHAGFVHHTVNANGYTRAQVPSIIRGIYAYHTQSRGWSDVGYNFLVDRFGRIWEGRAGGVTRPVVGAHTLGYNDYAFAMSAIGNFDVARPSAAMVDAYAKLFAWKLSLHGIDAGDMSQQVGRSTFHAVNGHRDAGQTACPGRYLYARLGAIRTKAVGYQRPFAARQVDADLSGSRWPDLVVRDKKTQEVSVVRTGGQLAFTGRTVAAEGLRGADLQVVSRDLTGDGVADLVTRDARTGVASIRAGSRAGTFGRVVTTTKRFQGMDQLAAVGDFDGDGRPDLVGRRADTKSLMLVPGAGRGTFGTSRRIAVSWAGYNLTSGAGDFDGDGARDLLARDTAGRLWLVPGTGKGGLRAPVALPGRWARFDVVSGGADVTNDGRVDIVARARKNQQTWLYPGNGAGRFSRRLGPFGAFRGLDFLASPGQVTGNRRADLVGRTEAGAVVVIANKGTRNIARKVQTGERFTNTDLILSVGDWNGDGLNDLMTRRTSDGAMLFRAGIKGRGFAAPVRAARGWGSVQLVAAVGDLTGDGYPDLMGQPRGGAMKVYPGNGRAGFKAGYVARGVLSGTKQIGPGLWNGDGSPDTILRRSDGTLWLYRGNGPGGLTGSAQRVGAKAQRYDVMVGRGDVNGDGRPDVVARQASTGDLWLLPGARNNTFGKRRLIGSGFGGYDLVG